MGGIKYGKFQDLPRLKCLYGDYAGTSSLPNYNYSITIWISPSHVSCAVMMLRTLGMRSWIALMLGPIGKRQTFLAI